MLRHRYGNADPLKVPSHDILMKYLRYRGKVSRRQELRQHTLRTSISIQVNDETETNIRLRGEAIGMYLHAIHKEEMFHFVANEVARGEEALGTLKHYFAARDISEDDYALDSAARLFRRWRKEIEKDRLTNKGEFVRYLLGDLSPICLSISQAKQVADLMQELINRSIIATDRRMDMAIRTFILYTFTSETYASIAKIEGRAFRHDVYNSCRRGREYLQYDERLHRWISYCINSIVPQPVPAAS